MEKKYYLAYGSNLNVWQMKIRCPKARLIGTADLKGWELLFRGSKTGSYLTIEKKKNGIVPVAIWEVTPSDEKALDRYEGFPAFYYKQPFEVKLGKKSLDAFAYIMHEERPIGIPSKAYMDTCKAGYEVFGFDVKLLTAAKKRSKEEYEK